MRQKRFLIYLGIQLLVILSVIIIFKINPDIKIASVEAGSLFVLMPPLLMWKEYQKSRFRRVGFFLGMGQFWLFFALPILGLRLFHWEAPFDELAFLGVPGPVLHRLANDSYGLMMILTFWSYLREPKG